MKLQQYQRSVATLIDRKAREKCVPKGYSALFPEVVMYDYICRVLQSEPCCSFLGCWVWTRGAAFVSHTIHHHITMFLGHHDINLFKTYTYKLHLLSALCHKFVQHSVIKAFSAIYIFLAITGKDYENNYEKIAFQNSKLYLQYRKNNNQGWEFTRWFFERFACFLCAK